MSSTSPGYPQNQSRWSTAGRIVVALVGLWIVLAIIGKLSGGGSNSYHATGETAYLVVEGNRFVNVAVSESACREMENAFADLDEQKLKGLLLTGMMFPADNHSKVIILESGINRAKVRITSGNQTGEIGWVPVGFLSSR